MRMIIPGLSIFTRQYYHLLDGIIGNYPHNILKMYRNADGVLEILFSIFRYRSFMLLLEIIPNRNPGYIGLLALSQPSPNLLKDYYDWPKFKFAYRKANTFKRSYLYS